jgi:DNA polymerase-3 subunit gamma/tau
LLEDLATELHRVQLHQLVPGFTDEGNRVDAAALAARLSPELVQLWFQMALNGRRDLGLAPSARAGLEMTLLRMLAFRPAEGAGEGAPRVASGAAKPAPAAAPPRSAPATREPEPLPSMRTPPPTSAPTASLPMPAAPSSAPAPAAAPSPVAYSGEPMPLASADDWFALVTAAGL